MNENVSLFLGNILVASGAFVILLLLIKKFAWGNITAIFEKRAKKISDDIDEAERARNSAQKLEKEREQKLLSSRQEAQSIIQTAKDSASKSRQNILAEAESEAQRKKQQANQDIAQSKSEALANVKDDVADLSLQIASKILGKELTKEGHQELINSFVEKLGENDALG